MDLLLRGSLVGGVVILGVFAVWLLAGPLVGRWVSGAVIAVTTLAVLAMVFSVGARRVAAPRTLLSVIVCLAAALLPLLAVLGYLDPAGDAASQFASSRDSIMLLSTDNELPSLLAQALRRDSYPVPLAGDWLASDRPPMQTGWLLLVGPMLSLLGFSEGVGDLAASMAAQSVWIAGAVVLVLATAMPRRTVPAAIATASLTGLALVNGYYTWPKLMGAGFMLAAVAAAVKLWRGRHERRVGPVAMLLPAALSALAMLTHGTAAFCVPPLLLLLCLATLGWWRALVSAVAFTGAFFAMQVPWMLWQRLGDPPGDRLLKYQLAGRTEDLTTPALQAITDAYAEAGWATAIGNKVTHFAQMLALPGGTPLSRRPGDWGEFLTAPFGFVQTGATFLSRNYDFFVVGFLLRWLLPLLAVVLLVAVVAPGLRPRASSLAAAWVPSLLWASGSAVVWAVLLFGPDGAIIHQGPAAILLLPFIALGAVVVGTSPWAWLLGVSIQAGLFCWLYLVLDNVTWWRGWGWAPVIAVMVMVLCSWLATKQVRGRGGLPLQHRDDSPGIAHRKGNLDLVTP